MELRFQVEKTNQRRPSIVGGKTRARLRQRQPCEALEEPLGPVEQRKTCDPELVDRLFEPFLRERLFTCFETLQCEIGGLRKACGGVKQEAQGEG
jgi:hypothetical protein